MKKLVELSDEEAKKHFLKGSSYFNGDMPQYINFGPILDGVEAVLKGKNYPAFKLKKPDDYSDVNYNFVANKDGKLAWRPFELIHPVIYVSLVNVLCDPENWSFITKHSSISNDCAIECCSYPLLSLDNQTDVAKQVKSWWQNVEQRSLIYSLEFSHILHTDVVDCYGSIYTHSIPWALHGKEDAKNNRKNSLLGNNIDSHIRAGRYGQTNGIPQGSVLMDFIAEIVLCYVDRLINNEFKKSNDFRILRCRELHP